MSVEIKQTLEREFEIFLTAQDIRSLSFAKLQEMSSEDDQSNNSRRNLVSGDTEVVTGMKLLVRLLGDVDHSPETCLRLPSKEEEGRTEVFLIPGVESVGPVFMTLAPKIKSPATCLQMGLLNSTYDSIPKMADYFLPVIIFSFSFFHHIKINFTWINCLFAFSTYLKELVVDEILF